MKNSAIGRGLFTLGILVLILSCKDTPLSTEMGSELHNPEYKSGKAKISGSEYSLLEIEFSEEGFSAAQAINNNNQVIGYFKPQLYESAFIWDNGEIEFLPDLEDRGATAYDINDQGQVVGSSTGSWVTPRFTTYYSKPVIWENGEITEIGDVAGGLGQALSINNKSEILITRLAEDFFSGDHIIWQNGEVQNILEGVTSRKITDNSHIVGSKNNTGINTGFIWENGNFTEIGSCASGGSSQLNDLNIHNQAVGSCVLPGNIYVSILWENGNFTEIGRDIFVNSSVVGINNNRQVVGYGNTGDNIFRPFVWENGEITMLQTLGGTLTVPIDINDNGWITGYGRNSEGETSALVWYIDSATPEEQVSDLISEVENLLSLELVKPNQIKVLTAILDKATKSLEQGKDNVAVNRLGAFKNKVRALSNSKRISLETADQLVEAANIIIDSINAEE